MHFLFIQITALSGTYCPGGVATKEVGVNPNSPLPCASGYYCPQASIVPTEKMCPNHTSSGILSFVIVISRIENSKFFLDSFYSSELLIYGIACASRVIMDMEVCCGLFVRS